MNEKNEIAEEVLQEINETIENENRELETDTNATTETKKKVKKHVEALTLVEKAKQIVKEADEQHESCKLLLAGDLKEYEDAKSALRAGGLDACVSLLEQLGYQNNTDSDTIAEKVVVFEPKDELEPIALKHVSSGRFTGFIYSLIAGAATFGGLVYLATDKLGMTLDISKVPSVETMKNIATWFSTAVGVEENLYVGAGILGLSTLAVMGLVYAIRVGLKGGKNLRFAQKQLAQAEEYTAHKGNCKAEMDRVDAHMKETVSLLKLYQVMFNEQKGKLERILHIEGSKEKSTDYHEKSFAEIRETKELVRTIKDFISTPMSQEGKLSEKSINFLKHAKTQMDKMLERLY